MNRFEYSGKEALRHETEYSKPGKLKSICINARSIVNKINDLQAIMESWDSEWLEFVRAGPMVMCLIPSLSVDGYDLFRVDRQGARGGGVLLYTRSTLQAVEFFPTTKFPEQCGAGFPQ